MVKLNEQTRRKAQKTTTFIGDLLFIKEKRYNRAFKTISFK